jgi:large subunit ribosomal protein L3
MIGKLFGTKMGMTRYFLEEGRSIPVTVVKVEPCVVIQKKSDAKEGYNAVQVAFGPRKDNRTNKPQKGHFKIAGKGCFSYLREIRVDNPENFELGQEFNAEGLTIGDIVHVTGISKGRGFAGVTKRWGFSGGKKTHGSRSHRVPGSIGCSATPGRVHKGKKLPGRMGSQRVTIKNLQVVDVRPEMDAVIIRGAIPGSRNSIVELCKG